MQSMAIPKGKGEDLWDRNIGLGFMGLIFR